MQSRTVHCVIHHPYQLQEVFPPQIAGAPQVSPLLATLTGMNMYVCTYVCMCVCVYAYIYTCLYVCMMYVCMYVSCVWVGVCDVCAMRVCVHVCVRVCVYVCRCRCVGV